MRRGLYTIHFIAACLVGGPALVLFCAAGLVHTLAFRHPATIARVANLFSRFMQRVLGWRIEVENREGLPSGEPAVVLVRHQSSLDVVTIGEILRPRSLAIGKKEVERIPFFGSFWKATGNVLVDRSNRERAIASMREAAETAKRKGLSVWAAPEGHRNMGQTLLPLKKGPFHLALAGQLPLVPVAVEPLISVIDASRWILRPGRVRIQVLPPIPTAGKTTADVDELMESVRRSLQEAQDALWATSPGPIL